MAAERWLSQLEAARRLAQDVAEKLQERTRCQRSGQSSAKINVAIRSSLQTLREKIDQLKELLLRAVSTHQITQLEGDRRQNLVDDLLTRYKQLEASYKNEGPDPDMTRELGEAEEDPVSSFMCLLKKKKEVRRLEKFLAEREEAFRERMEVIAEQWKDLRARRAELKVHMESCGSTIQENEMLRNRALKKANKDREDNIKRDNELLRAKRELEALRKQHQKLCQKLSKYSVFKRYLEDVVEISQFRDVEEITSFYKILLRSRKELLQAQQWHKELAEQAKVRLEQYRAEKEAEILHCKSDLVQLKQYLDQARSNIPLWEDHWVDIQNRAAKKVMELRAIEMAIHNLFQSASTRMKAKWRVAADDSYRQLIMIHQFIRDLRDISMEDIKKYK